MTRHCARTTQPIGRSRRPTHDEALELLRKVEPLLRGFGDQRRLVRLNMLKGMVQYRQRRLPDARVTFEKALEEVSPDDLHTRAMLYMNLGLACADLGDFSDAVLMYSNARQLLTDLGMTVELNRTEWNLAHVLLLTGDFEKAAPMLKRVREFFLGNGMPEEAGLAGLDLADASIALNAPEGARELVSAVLTEFTTAKLNERALTALAYLRDVLPTTPKPIHAVRHVRQYLDQLRTEPALLFLPLPE